MHLKKSEYRPPKIKSKMVSCLKKAESGQIEWVVGMFFLLFLAILLYAMLQVEIYRTTSQYLEDALAASNLASAVIDVEEYGISHNIVIDNPLLAFERYQAALKGNLNLDENWQCANRSMITGAVTVEEYIVYNCVQEQVFVCRVGKKGILSQWQGPVGSIKAPNGIVIESTGIYSEISFPVRGFLRNQTEARKGKLVDIVANEGAASAQ